MSDDNSQPIESAQLRGSRGARFEQRFFGPKTKNPGKREGRQDTFVNFVTAVQTVFYAQASLNWDPKNIPSERSLAKNLCDAVKAALARLAVAHAEELALYKAVGSHLDALHRIDGFFELRGAIVTFDLTTAPVKVKRRIMLEKGVSDKGAEVILSQIILNDQDGPAYKALVEEIAAKMQANLGDRERITRFNIGYHGNGNGNASGNTTGTNQAQESQ